MPVIRRAIRIEAPPEAVWAVLADIPGQPRWMRDLKSVQLTTSGPVGVGTRAVGRVRMFGLAADDPIEIDVFEPGRHFGLRHLGAFVGRGDIRLRSAAGGTIVSWREELRLDPGRLRPPHALAPLWSLGLPRALGLLWRLIDPGSGVVLSLVFRSDLRRLRAVVEGGIQAP